MTGTPPFDLEKLFEGSLNRLRVEAEYFSRLTDHNPELGRLNESHLVKLLRAYLPPKIGIGTGFIVSGGETPSQSPQCDIILYDALNNAPFYSSDTWSIFPVEMVYGVIEVKTTLTTERLRESFRLCAKVRSMATTPDGNGNKRYTRMAFDGASNPVRIVYAVKLPPRFFLFAYQGWETREALDENFRTVSGEELGAHVHGVCNLHKNGSLYVGHVAFGKGNARFSEVRTNGFFHFLQNLPLSLDSMLPPERMGTGFDQVWHPHYHFASDQSD